MYKCREYMDVRERGLIDLQTVDHIEARLEHLCSKRTDYDPLPRNLQSQLSGQRDTEPARVRGRIAVPGLRQRCIVVEQVLRQ